MNTKDNLEEFKKAIANGAFNIGEIAKSLKIPPSKKRVLNMTKDDILQYNALIFHKGCKSLSSAERKMVQDRVAYGLKNGTIKTEEVAKEINMLNALIQGELKKKIYDDSSINK
tara:strand:- start:159 stop:500 length:342 start_codon:yes stop_codon:yes gene_type:complete